MPASKVRRAVAIGAIVALVAAGCAAAWLWLSLDAFVKREIERAGTEATGTRVTVGGVDVVLKKGSGTVSSLRIANPKGFSHAAVLEADGIDFDVDLASLRKDVLVVESVVVTRPRLRFELDGAGHPNVEALGPRAPASPSSSRPRRLRIDRLVIRGGSVDADASAVQGKSDTVSLRDIVLTNVGGRDGGTSDEVAAEIVAAVRQEVTRAVVREGFRRYMEGEGGAAKEKLKDRLKGLFGR